MQSNREKDAILRWWETKTLMSLEAVFQQVEDEMAKLFAAERVGRAPDHPGPGQAGRH